MAVPLPKVSAVEAGGVLALHRHVAGVDDGHVSGAGDGGAGRTEERGRHGRWRRLPRHPILTFSPVAVVVSTTPVTTVPSLRAIAVLAALPTVGQRTGMAVVQTTSSGRESTGGPGGHEDVRSQAARARALGGDGCAGGVGCTRMIGIVGGARVEGDGHHAVRIVAAGMDLPAVDDLDRRRGPAAVGFTLRRRRQRLACRGCLRDPWSRFPPARRRVGSRLQRLSSRATCLKYPGRSSAAPPCVVTRPRFTAVAPLPFDQAPIPVRDRPMRLGSRHRSR